MLDLLDIPDLLEGNNSNNNNMSRHQHEVDIINELLSSVDGAFSSQQQQAHEDAIDSKENILDLDIQQFDLLKLETGQHNHHDQQHFNSQQQQPFYGSQQFMPQQQSFTPYGSYEQQQQQQPFPQQQQGLQIQEISQDGFVQPLAEKRVTVDRKEAATRLNGIQQQSFEYSSSPTEQFYPQKAQDGYDPLSQKASRSHKKEWRKG